MFCGEAGHGLWQSTPKGGRVCRTFEIFEKECETFETQHFSLKDREDDLVAMLATALRPKLKPADPRLAALGGPPSTAPPQPPAKAPPPPPGEVQDAALKAPQLGLRSKAPPAALDPNRVLPVKAQALPPGPLVKNAPPALPCKAGPVPGKAPPPPPPGLSQSCPASAPHPPPGLSQSVSPADRGPAVFCKAPPAGLGVAASCAVSSDILCGPPPGLACVVPYKPPPALDALGRVALCKSPLGTPSSAAYVGSASFVDRFRVHLREAAVPEHCWDAAVEWLVEEQAVDFAEVLVHLEEIAEKSGMRKLPLQRLKARLLRE